MKVVHLNASDKGGASIVAQRLNSALNEYTQVQSQHLIFDGDSNNLDATVFWSDNFLRKVRAKWNHILDKFDFLQNERDAKIRFQFNHARMGVDVSTHPLVLDADIIHIHWILKGFLSFDSLKKLIDLGKPIVWTCHDLWPFTGGCFYLWGCERLTAGCGECPYLYNAESNDLSSILLKKKIELFKWSGINWAAPSRWLGQVAKTSRVLNSDIVFSVIPNPIKVSSFHVINGTQKSENKVRFNLNPTKFTLLFSAANLGNPAKGFPDFIKILEDIHNSEIQAIVLGESKEPINLPIPFHYAGYVRSPDHVRSLFGAADLYITTSLEDNLPTTVMESLACGIPALGYNIGGIPELIDDGSTGFVFPKGDWQAMAGGVLRLLENPDLHAQFSINARGKAETEYEESIVAKSYANLYKEVLQKGI